MRSIGAIHISSKHAVSPRDQTTYNRRISGTLIKSRILKLDQVRFCAGRRLFNLGRLVIGRYPSYQQQASLIE